jgi:taurine---2-oxoglutarate transaminase
VTVEELTRAHPGLDAIAPNDPDWVAAAHREFTITSWSVQSSVHPITITGGEGCWFWDAAGKRYLDFQSQLVNLNLGHQHPRLVEAIKRQADKLCYIGPAMANDARSELAALIAAVTPGDLKSSFLTTGGAAANENAIRLARQYTGRNKIITRYRSYHGATAGAISLTGDPRRWPTEPGMPGVVRMFDPYTYRCPAGHPDPCPVCSGAPHLEEILMYEGPQTVAAVMLETVTGTNGLIYPPDGYLASIREVCDRHDILLIFDEVMAGFGRTGAWFACDHWGVVPDILCVAKGLNSGYVPLGAMVVSQPIADWLEDHLFPGGMTYAGHPLACATGVESIRVYLEDDIVGHAAAMGELLSTLLTELADRHPSIGDVRGRGLFFGIELVRDRESRAPLVPFNAKGIDAVPMKELIGAAMDAGVYLSSFSNVVRLTPPLIIPPDELRLGVELLDAVLDLADRHYEGAA